MRVLFLSLLVFLSLSAIPADATPSESAYERVMRTGTLRCGYILYDPVIRKDPNTGLMSGILVDILQDMTSRLSLKLEWTEEVPFVTAFEGLKEGRYDAVCTALWGWPAQARVGLVVGPMYYYPIGIWVRAQDSRFDRDRSAINQKGIKISGVDGTFPLDAARVDFPEAEALTLPQSSDYAQPLMDVVAGKADVTFMDNNIGLRFLASHPGSLRNVASRPPYRIFGQFIMVSQGEHSLAAMLQTTSNLLVLDGTVDRILKRYEAGQGGYYRVSIPYALPQE